MSTAVAPIRIPQINYTYYVGEAMLGTIQQAVTFAVSMGAGTVVIPQEYAGADSITAATGGSSSVFIIDMRGGNRQTYVWWNNAYIMQPFDAMGGLVTPKINHYAYVGIGTNPTIQGTITTLAAYPTLHFVIIISPSYTGSEVIGNLTGANANMVISDQRTDQWQNYYWNGTNFVPSDLSTLGDLNIGGDIYATNADLSGNLQANDATFDTCMVSNSPVRTFANTADPAGPSYPPAGIGVSTGTAWSPTSIDPTTLPRLNTPNTFTAAPQIVSEGGSWMKVRGNVPASAIDITHTGLTLCWNPTQATERSAFVNVSATQTAGAGFAWYNVWTGSSGVDATTPLMLLDAQGNMTVRANANAPSGTSSTFTTRDFGFGLTWNLQWGFGETDFINTHPSGAGGGFSWWNALSNTTLTQANTPLMHLDGLGSLSIAGAFTTAANSGTGQPLVAPANGLAIGWNATNSWGETDFVNSMGGGGGGFNWYNVAAGTIINMTTPPAMILDSLANLTVPGHITSNVGLAAGPLVPPDNVRQIILDGQGNASGVLNVLRLASVNLTDPTTAGGVLLVGYSQNLSVTAPYFSAINSATTGSWIQLGGNVSVTGGTTLYGALAVDGTTSMANGLLRIGAAATGGWGSGTANINTDSSSLMINAAAGNGIFFNWNQGSIVYFGNGSGGQVASIDYGGSAHFNGTLTAGVKSFRITHPLDNNKDLTHSCIEGPEIAVYYRGEAITHDGTATVTLPDYFEALTLTEDRTVQLTQIFEDDSEAIIGSNTFSMLMASRVKDGKFTIRSSEQVAKVWWEVMAIRADVPQLIVETVKEPPRDAPIPPRPDNPAEPLPGPIGSGTPQAGEPKPKTVRAGNSVAAGSSRTRKLH